MGRILWLGLVVLALLPAAAPAQEPAGLKSPGVEYLGTVADPATISARFRGNLMYLSTLKGLSIYDVSNPAVPALQGRLALPHFQNEDVDLALERDILLISEDPNEGQGILHIIDISDPSAPAELSFLNTGFSDGTSEIIYNFFLRDLPGIFGLPPFPVDSPLKAGNGHTASCVQPRCDYALLAGNLQGLFVVDLRDAAAPALLKKVPVEEATFGLATHDVQFDKQPDGTDLAWVSGAGGVAAYKVSELIDPAVPDPAAVLQTDPAQSRSDYGSDVGTDIDPNTGEPTGKKLNDFIHHNSLRLKNSSLAEPPPGAAPAERSGVLLITEEDYTRPDCNNAGSFQTWGLGPEGHFRNLDEWRVEEHGETDTTGDDMCSAHYFDEHTGLVAQGWYQEGTRFFDVSDPQDIRQVGYWIPDGALTWSAYFPPTDPSGEIVYSLDFPRGLDVLRINRPASGGPWVQEPDPPTRDPDDGGDGNGQGASSFDSPGYADPEGAPPVVAPQAAPAPAAAPRAHLAVRVTGRQSLRRGNRGTFKITVRNVGASASPAVVRLRLPARLRHVRGGSRRGRTVTFRAASLQPGARRTFKLVVRARRAVKRVRFGPTARPSARANALMPTVRAPRRGRRSSPVVLFESRYGAVCRIPLSAS